MDRLGRPPIFESFTQHVGINVFLFPRVPQGLVSMAHKNNSSHIEKNGQEQESRLEVFFCVFVGNEQEWDGFQARDSEGMFLILR